MPVHAWPTASTFLIILFCYTTVIEISFPEFSSTEKKEDGDILLKVFQKVQSQILSNKYLRIMYLKLIRCFNGKSKRFISQRK